MLKLILGCHSILQYDGRSAGIPWSDLLVVSDSKMIARGAFGEIYRAKWGRNSSSSKKAAGGGQGALKSTRTSFIAKPVAVKIIKIKCTVGTSENEKYETAMGQALYEARMIRQASCDDFNDYCVKLHGIAHGPVEDRWMQLVGGQQSDLVAETDEGFCMVALVLKFEAGGTLYELLRAEKRNLTYDVKERIRLLKEIATGLSTLHINDDGPIVHKHLSPKNILLSTDEGMFHPKIVDFSLSVATDFSMDASAYAKANNMDIFIRDSAYSAPELLSSSKVLPSTSCDIFSFGAIMVDVLSKNDDVNNGYKMWSEYSYAERQTLATPTSTLIVGQRHNTLLPSPELDTKLVLGVPSNVKNLIRRCLDENVDNRPNIDEVRIILELIFDHLTLSVFDVFLSYAWGNNEFRKHLAEQIYLMIKNNGYTVWMDRENMVWSSDMNASMSKGIESSKSIVILLSPDYVESENCMFELKRAIELRKSVIVCMVAEDTKYVDWIKKDGSKCITSDFVKMIHLETQKWADFSQAAKIKPETDITKQRKLVTHDLKAGPVLLRALQELGINAKLEKSSSTILSSPFMKIGSFKRAASNAFFSSNSSINVSSRLLMGASSKINEG
jgi:serine/threonine protein kinase